jgi:ankyrin repeat protein
MLKHKYSRDLIAAIEANDMEKLQALVDKGGDLDALPYNELLADGLVNIPPLIMATTKSNFEAVKILVEAGADVNIKATFGYYPPLLESIYCWRDVGNFDIAYYLIDNGANIHQKDRTTGRTAIHLCAAVGDENKQAEHLDFFEYLLKKGASFNESTEGHIAFGACYSDYNLYMLKYLFENYEIDVNMRSIKDNRETMLMKTVQNGGAIKICEYLLSKYLGLIVLIGKNVALP